MWKVSKTLSINNQRTMSFNIDIVYCISEGGGFLHYKFLFMCRKIVHEFKDKTETEVENAEPFICSCGVSFSSSRTLK